AYYVRAESPGACGNSNCINTIVNVNPLPNGFISGNTSICYGASANIIFNFTVGSGPFDVQYRDNFFNTYTATNVTNTGTANVSPTVTSTYTIISITDANGCNAPSGFGAGATVTVTPLPVITSVTPTST